MDTIAMKSWLTSLTPMLAAPQNGTRLETLVGTHTFDVKLDGVRAIALWDGGDLTIRNRTGRDITHRYPELSLDAMRHFGTEPFVIDGEITALTGSFQDVSKRDKQTKPEDVARAMKLVPIEFVAFDVIWQGDTDLRHHRYTTRREMLEALPLTSTFNRSVTSDDLSLYENVVTLGMEGVIAKLKSAPYQPGRRGDWTKFKVTHSITCVAVGYEPGKGARSDFGAMFIAMLDGPTPVSVGRVGSGFTRPQIDDIKARLDKGELPVVEIECLNVTKTGVLRFPVFKGERTDLSVLDATIDQLAPIPRM